MNTTHLFIILIIGTTCVGIIAIMRHRKRIKKINKIETQCDAIIVLADSILDATITNDIHLVSSSQDFVRNYAQRYMHPLSLKNSESVLKSEYLTIEHPKIRSIQKDKLCYQNYTRRNLNMREAPLAYQRNYLVFG